MARQETKVEPTWKKIHTGQISFKNFSNHSPLRLLDQLVPSGDELQQRVRDRRVHGADVEDVTIGGDLRPQVRGAARLHSELHVAHLLRRRHAETPDAVTRGCRRLAPAVEGASAPEETPRAARQHVIQVRHGRRRVRATRRSVFGFSALRQR